MGQLIAALIAAFVFGIVVGAFVVWALIAPSREHFRLDVRLMRQIAVDRGFAHWGTNSGTGELEFQWKSHSEVVAKT